MKCGTILISVLKTILMAPNFASRMAIDDGLLVEEECVLRCYGISNTR